MQTFPIKESLRKKLKEPFGKLIENSRVTSFLLQISKDDFLISVGDRTTKNCISAGLAPRLEIIDNREKRNPVDTLPYDGSQEIKAVNPSGHISLEAVKTIQNLLKSNKRSRIVVDGEEDLLVLPCVLFAPDGAKVLYGQPDKGLVEIVVNKRNRKKVEKIMQEIGWVATN
ncbi:MAG: DUF359 domain-containing protein [Conexivisphaerales archaeon]